MDGHIQAYSHQVNQIGIVSKVTGINSNRGQGKRLSKVVHEGDEKEPKSSIKVKSVIGGAYLARGVFCDVGERRESKCK